MSTTRTVSQWLAPLLNTCFTGASPGLCRFTFQLCRCLFKYWSFSDMWNEDGAQLNLVVIGVGWVYTPTKNQACLFDPFANIWNKCGWMRTALKNELMDDIIVGLSISLWYSLVFPAFHAACQGTQNRKIIIEKTIRWFHYIWYKKDTFKNVPCKIQFFLSEGYAFLFTSLTLFPVLLFVKLVLTFCLCICFQSRGVSVALMLSLDRHIN